MIKRMLIMLVAVAIILGGVFGFKVVVGMKIKEFMAGMGNQPQTVSTTTATKTEWQDRIEAVGSLRAVQRRRSVARGRRRRRGDQLPVGRRRRGGQAAAAAARQRRCRQAQVAAGDGEALHADLPAQSRAAQDACGQPGGGRQRRRQPENFKAQVTQQKAIVDKKLLRAPFAGRLGLRQVDLGQYLPAGTAIVTLQALTPIFADFFLPQQALDQIKVGQTVTARGRHLSRPDRSPARSPRSTPRSRPARATCRCAPRWQRRPALLPGMYATVEVAVGAPRRLRDAAADGHQLQSLRQHWSTWSTTRARARRQRTGWSCTRPSSPLGATRGDQVAVLKGVEEGQTCGHRRPDEAAQRRAGRRSTTRCSRPTTPSPGRSTGSDGAAMKFTDIFIRRPVLAMVVSLLILVLGLRAVGTLPVLQYPRTRERRRHGDARPTTAPIPTWSRASSPRRWRHAIAQANGIDYMTSTSTSGVSTITVNLRLNYDSNKALTEINTKVNSVLNRLPPGSQQPVLTVKVGQTIDAMYIGFSSKRAGAQPDHRLPRARRAAQAAGGRRACRPPSSSAPRTSRCAPGSIRRSSRPTG